MLKFQGATTFINFVFADRQKYEKTQQFGYMAEK